MLQSNNLLQIHLLGCYSFYPLLRISKKLQSNLPRPPTEAGSGNVKERYKKLIERVYDSEVRGCRHVFDGAGDTGEVCCLTFDSA